MRFEIFNVNMNRVTLIDKYISMLWREEYNGTGAFLLELTENDDYIKSIRPDCFVTASGRSAVMVITSVTVKNGIITASGKMASWIMSNMVCSEILRPKFDVSSGLIEIADASDLVAFLLEAITSAYNNHPKYGYSAFNYNAISRLGNVWLNDYYGEETGKEPVLDIVKRVCKLGDIGFMIRKSTDGASAPLYLYLYKPSDADANIKKTFSPEFGNMKDYSITWSVENYKNYAVALLAEDQTEGFAVDGGDTPTPYRDTVINVSSYKNHDVALGTAHAQLKNFDNIVNVSFTPIGDGFDIGDVVRIVINKYGVDVKRRIIKYTIQESKNKVSKSIEVGTPIAKIAYVENGRTVYY